MPVSLLTIINGGCFLMVPLLQLYGHNLRKLGGKVPYNVPGVRARPSEAGIASPNLRSSTAPILSAHDMKDADLQLEDIQKHGQSRF